MAGLVGLVVEVGFWLLEGLDDHDPAALEYGIGSEMGTELRVAVAWRRRRRMKKKTRARRRMMKMEAPIAMPAIAPFLRPLLLDELFDEVFEEVATGVSPVVELAWLMVMMLAGLPLKSAWDIEKFPDS